MSVPAQKAAAKKPVRRASSKSKPEAELPLAAPGDPSDTQMLPSAGEDATETKPTSKKRRSTARSAAVGNEGPEANAQPLPAAVPRESPSLQTTPGAALAEMVSAPAQSQDSAKKTYPVYVPLHVAKQMEQEGKPAPLSVSKASLGENHELAPSLNQSPASPYTTNLAAAVPRELHADQRLENRHQESRQSRQEQHRPERHSDRRRGRHERRRGDRREFNEFHDSTEGRQELPPPLEEELYSGEGIIEISGKGFGFLRDARRGFAQNAADVFVSPEMVRRYNLRDGQWVKGDVRKGGRGQQMHRIESINDDDPERSRFYPAFEELTVINPQEPLRMETRPDRYTTRVIDLVAPIGKGQRGLIVAPPRTGKTTMLQHIADALVKNHPDVKLLILLVDERPEEVTEIKLTVPTAEIMASSNDMDVRSHTRIAELAIERAKRLVESGRDVFILLDSITRLGRAFNNALSGGGRTMSGGIDARALEIPRRLFAAARNTEEAGSLTIVATALIETGSRMDELIFQEFKGTGNMELVLDRKIAEQRIYPAVDIFQSGTRREELLIPADALQKIHFIRRGLAGCRPMDAIDRLLFYLKKFPTNEQMLREIRG
jgi:transcription termination factor Rho